VSGLGEPIGAVAEAAADAFPSGGETWWGLLFWFGLTALLLTGAWLIFVR